MTDALSYMIFGGLLGGIIAFSMGKAIRLLIDAFKKKHKKVDLLSLSAALSGRTDSTQPNLSNVPRSVRPTRPLIYRNKKEKEKPEPGEKLEEFPLRRIM